MSALDITPNEAVCLDCGYLLRGLPGTVCPECGRAFDPNDSSTYGIAGDLHRWRRIKIACLLMVLLGLLYAVAPRGMLHGNINLTCSTCGLTKNVSRWQLRPPQWIPFRYPGMSRIVNTTAINATVGASRHKHQFTVRVRADLHLRRSFFSTSLSFIEGQRASYNGVQITMDTLTDVLHHLLARDNLGIGP